MQLFVWTVSDYYFIIYILLIRTVQHFFFTCNVSYINFFTFDNDDMRSSKRHVTRNLRECVKISESGNTNTDQLGTDFFR